MKLSESEEDNHYAALQKSQQLDRTQQPAWYRSIYLCLGSVYLIVLLILFFVTVGEKPVNPPLATVDSSQISTNMHGILIYTNGTTPIVNDTEYFPHEQVFIPEKYQYQWKTPIISIDKFDKYGLVQLFKTDFGGNYSLVEWIYPNKIEGTFQYQKTTHLHFQSDCRVKPVSDVNVGSDGYIFVTCPGDQTFLYNTKDHSTTQTFPYSFDAYDIMSMGSKNYLIAGMNFDQDISKLQFAQIFIFTCNFENVTSPCQTDDRRNNMRLYDIENLDLMMRIDPYTVSGSIKSDMSFDLVIKYAVGETTTTGTLKQLSLSKQGTGPWQVTENWFVTLNPKERFYSIDFALYGNKIYYILQTTISNLVYVYPSNSPQDEFNFNPLGKIIQIFRADDKIEAKNRTISQQDRLLIFALKDRIQLFDMENNKILEQYQLYNYTISAIYFNKFKF